ncbi:MAG: porin [Planctomycetes bacterium]|nr:porin [Planctomycetota bacterium]
MKRLFTFASGLLLAAITAVPATADESLSFSISDELIAEPVSMLGDAPTPGQKDDSCACDAKGDKGGKGGKGGCSCYLWGPDEAHSLYSGDNSLGISVGGWTQFGYHSDNSVADFFNTNEDMFNLHQQWLYAERTADGSCGWDWGFRADFMYGTDANNTQAFGNNPGAWDYLNGFDHGIYGWAIPQLYAELANGDFSVKLGHFYTLIGYEVVTAPDNFFYSHAFTMNNSEPFTHTGAIATYGYSDNLTLYGGWTAGWDTGFDQLGNGSSWLGGFGYSLSDDVSLTYMSTYGDFGWLAPGVTNSYSHSVVLDVTLTDNLNYVFQSDMVKAGTFDTVGINQYLFYALNDCTSLGARVEWWKNDGVSLNAATFGLNYQAHANLVLRPEIKHEWVPNANVDQTIFGMDAILTY